MSDFIEQAVAWFGEDASDAAEAAAAATERVLALLDGTDLSGLARHNHGLRGFGWTHYITASRWRIVAAVMALRNAGVGDGERVLDDGSFFGNVSIALARLGFQVSSADFYEAYEGTLDACRDAIVEAGGQVIDAGRFGDAIPIGDSVFDAAICMGVIEHIPHTPRLHMLDLRRVLRPGGLLYIETPNLAYGAKRAALARGESPLQPIAHQFDVEPPFTGHHREYTGEELVWMLERIGFDDVSLGTLDYSSTPMLTNDRAASERELIMVVGTRVESSTPAHRVEADLMCLESHQAQIEHAATGAMIRTGVTTSLYAAVLPLPDAADSRGIIVDAEVTSGCMSVGLLDLQTQRFIAVEILPVGPRLRTTLAAGHALPHQTQLVISNHRDTPAESTMMLHGVAVLAPRPQHARSHRP